MPLSLKIAVVAMMLALTYATGLTIYLASTVWPEAERRYRACLAEVAETAPPDWTGRRIELLCRSRRQLSQVTD